MTAAWTDFHGMFGGCLWRISSDGVDVQHIGTLRTPGEPLTMRSLWRQYRSEVQQWAFRFGVSVELLLATMATESAVVDGCRDPKQVRCEPGYRSDETTPDRISVGLCHVTIATAREVLGFPVSRGWLGVPANNLQAAAAVIRHMAAVHDFDIVKVFAAYNAGGLYSSEKNRWHLRSTATHIDRGAAWFGDAVAVVKESGGCQRDQGWLLHAVVTGTL